MWKRHLGKTLATFVSMLVVSGILLIWSTNNTIRDAYCQWWVADMIIEHLIAHQNRWPQSWDDLRDDYETRVARSGQHWTFEELKDRVGVDWDVNIEELKAATASPHEPPFRVVWPTKGFEGDHWERREPNRLIWDHLQSTVSSQ